MSLQTIYHFSQLGMYQKCAVPAFLFDQHGRQIETTREYDLFQKRNIASSEDLLHDHGWLYDSMEKFGFLPCFPVICESSDGGRLTVLNGHHRLAVAELLGLPVHYVIDRPDPQPTRLTRRLLNRRGARVLAADAMRSMEEPHTGET